MYFMWYDCDISVCTQTLDSLLAPPVPGALLTHVVYSQYAAITRHYCYTSATDCARHTLYGFHTALTSAARLGVMP